MPIKRELDLLSEDLRRQRVDLDEQIAEQTQTHSNTNDLLKKIEELRLRMERTNPGGPGNPTKK